MPRSRRYQSATVEALELTVQCVGALGVVEGEDALVPARPGHAFGLLRLQAHAARDDEHVVGEHRPVVEQHLVALDPDLFDLVLVEDDPVAQLAPPRPHDLSYLRESEGHEEDRKSTRLNSSHVEISY